MTPTDAATPCGLIAKSLFNDTYQIMYSDTRDGIYTSLNINETNIAWASDVEHKFSNTPGLWEDK